MNNNDTTPPNPLADPTHCDALKHPGDVHALRTPGVVTARSEDMLSNAAITLDIPGPSEPAIPCDRTARCALNAGHTGDCLPPPEFTPGQAAFVSHETACELVRSAVVLPVMPPAWQATRAIQRGLRAAQNLVHVWADVGDEVLGELTHAQSGLHASIMNVSGFAAQAAEGIDRAVSLPTQWTATFNAIVSEATKYKAWRMIGLAAGALLAGPFTLQWDNALEWCIAYWAR